MSETLVVNLGQYQVAGTRMFAGRDRGEWIRRTTGLGHWTGEMVIKIPQDTYAVTTTFLLALLGKTIRARGVEAFRATVRFQGKDITETVYAAIRAATHELVS